MVSRNSGTCMPFEALLCENWASNIQIAVYLFNSDGKMDTCPLGTTANTDVTDSTITTGEISDSSNLRWTSTFFLIPNQTVFSGGLEVGLSFCCLGWSPLVFSDCDQSWTLIRIRISRLVKSKNLITNSLNHSIPFEPGFLPIFSQLILLCLQCTSYLKNTSSNTNISR